MNYGELKTAIQDYCQSSETTFVNNLNNFIIAAEDRVFAAIDMPSRWEDDDNVTLVAGTAEYVLGDAGTDPGIIDVLSIRVAESASATPQAEGVEYGPVRYLLQKDYDFLLEAYPGTSTEKDQGIPSYYAISQSGTYSGNAPLTIRLGPIPDAVYPTTVTYYGKTSAQSITGQGSDSGTTWLSTTFPDVLLYGSLVQAYTYLKGEPDMIQLYEKQFMDGLTLLKNVVEKRMDNDAYRPSVAPTSPRGN